MNEDSAVRTLPLALRFDVCASEPSPVYPAMFAACLGTIEHPAGRVSVRAQPTRAELFRSISAGECTLAVLSASSAARAIADGLAARIVSAAVSPVDLAAIEREPPMRASATSAPWSLVAPRAVLVAPERWLDDAPLRVLDAITAYWSAATLAQQSPSLLGVVLATELGLSATSAEFEARRAVSRWRLDPAVRIEGLQGVLAALRARGELDVHVTAEMLLDERFIPASRAA